MRKRQAGFTLIEVLIAVVLVDVGLLALVAASAVLIRQTAEMRARSAAVRAAGNRLQQLSGKACAPASGSASGAFGVREEWTVTLYADGVREVRDSVTYSTLDGARSVVLRTRVPC